MPRKLGKYATSYMPEANSEQAENAHSAPMRAQPAKGDPTPGPVLAAAAKQLFAWRWPMVRGCLLPVTTTAAWQRGTRLATRLMRW